MDKSISKNLVASVRAYLAGIGHEVTTVQGYEIVARAHGFENKHTLAAAKGNHASTPIVKEPDEQPGVGEIVVIDDKKYIYGEDGARYRFLDDGDTHLTVEEMKSLNWSMNVVVPVDAAIVGNIDALNDQVSELITGKDYALCGMDYEVFPYHYGNDAVAMLVNGFIEEPEQVFELDQDDAPEPALAKPGALMPQKDMIALAHYLELARTRQIGWYTTLVDGVPHEHKVVWDGDSEFDFVRILANLHEMKYYAETGQDYTMRIDNREVEIDFETAMHEMVFEHIDTVIHAEEDDGMFLHIEDIAWGRRVNEKVWEFLDNKGDVWRLGFDRDAMKLEA